MPIVARAPFVWIVMHLGLALMNTLAIVGVASLVRLVCILLWVDQARGRLYALLIPVVGFVVLVSAYNVRDALAGRADWLYIASDYAPILLLGLLWALSRVILSEYEANR